MRAPEDLNSEALRELAAYQDAMKRDLGAVDIEAMVGGASEVFDRRRFGKLCCPYCGHENNPFYLKSLVSKPWQWVWVGMDHKRPEQAHEYACGGCGEKLYFVTYIAQ